MADDSPDETKALSKSVSLLPALWDRVEAKASKAFGGNRSSYFRSLAEADLGRTGEGAGSNALVELARRYHPGIAEDLNALCFEKDGVTPRISQSQLLNRLLEATALALRAQKETEERFGTARTSAIQAELARLRQIEDSFFQIAATITGYVPQPNSDLLVAEPPARDAKATKPKGRQQRPPGAAPPVSDTG